MELTSAVRAVCLLGLVGVVACGDDDGTGPGDGQPPEASFAYELSGDLQLSVSGDSLEIEIGEAFGAGTLWQLHLQGGVNNGGGGISFVHRGQAPSEGAYTVTPVFDESDLGELEPDEFAAFAELDDGSQSTRFLGFEISGEVVIDRADALGYEGTFDFTADGNAFPPGESGQDAVVDFSGSFSVPR